MPAALQLLERARQLHEQAVAEGHFGHAAQAIRTLRRALRILEQAPLNGTGINGTEVDGTEVDGTEVDGTEVDGTEAPRELEQQRDALIAWVWLSLAVNEAEVHGVERGLAAIAEAERRARGVQDRSILVRLHSNYGFLATRAGDLDVATDQLGQARAMIDYATPHDRVYILLNSGNVCLYRGELPRARRLLESASSAARTEDFADGQFRALHNLGYVEFLSGDIPSALATLDAAAALGADVSLGIWALDRSRILLESGLTREADETLARAGRIFAQDRLAQDQGEVEVARAECALLVGDIDAARRFAGRARDRFRRRGNVRWMRTAELVLLQGDLAAGRPGGRLASVAARLEAELWADGLPSRARTAGLVEVEALLTAGRLADAEAAAQRLGRSTRNEPITARIHARYVRSRLELARGDRAAARRVARSGLSELALYQARFGSIDLQTASAVHGRRLADLDLAMALESGRTDTVLAAIERGRAVTSRLPAVQPPEDETTAALLTELRQVVESLHAAQSGTGPLLTRRHDLERRIVARSWTLPGRGEVSGVAEPDAIRTAVAAQDVTLVAFGQTGGRLHAVVVDSRGGRLVHLGPPVEVMAAIRRTRADFDALAYALLPGGLRGAIGASLSRSLETLDEALLAPLDVAGRRLVVVPTGPLATLPWAALPSRRGVPLVVAPSATAWMAAAWRGRTGSGVRALAGPGLTRAGGEVQAVSGCWPDGEAHTGAGRDSLLAAFAGARIVHVAAHGQHQTQNPLFSSIRLTDGPVFAHELRRTAPHVVLSACELGIATVRPGDEALGLTSVLLHLGTASVVSGVARVGDDAAASAMVDYHRELAAGRPSDEALAAALEARPEPLPFVCFGAAWSADG